MTAPKRVTGEDERAGGRGVSFFVEWKVRTKVTLPLGIVPQPGILLR